MSNSSFIQKLLSAYPNQGITPFLTAPVNQQLLVHSVSMFNGTAAPNSMGILNSINDAQVKIFTLGVADVNVTADLTGSGQGGVAIFTTTNNQGVLFQSVDKFNMVGMVVSQNPTGSPVYSYEYFDGSGWEALTLLNTPPYLSSQDNIILFQSPIDWAPGCGSEGGDQAYYSIRALATTAPSQAIEVDSVLLGKMIKFSDEIPASGNFDIDCDPQPYLLQSGESIIPFFSYSDPLNTIEIDYKFNP